MGYIKAKGLIIKEVNTGEADKIVTVFTKNEGKLSAFAKGARRTKSSLAAGTQFLCYSDFVMFKGRDMYSINTCEVIEPFYEIRNHIERLTYAAHVIDITGDVVQENQPSTKVLQLVLNTLHVLSKTDKSPELAVRIFELRLMSILGYAPYVGGCMECGCEEFENLSFSFKKCGFICRKCEQSDPYALEISPAAAKAINYIVYSKINDLFSFNLSQAALDELSRISRRYVRERLERDYTKLDFLKNLKL